MCMVMTAMAAHLVVADDAEMTSESIGDAFMKTVIISAK